MAEHGRVDLDHMRAAYEREQARVPVWLVARLNGDELEPDDKEP
jgi:hypothetical protein